MRHHHAPAPAHSPSMGTAFLVVLVGIFVLLALSHDCGEGLAGTDSLTFTGR